MKTRIKVLKAFHGDSILVNTYDQAGLTFILLIDGGPSNTFEYAIRKELSNIDCLHLLVLTHIDSDHIGGLLKFFKSSLFQKVDIQKYWANGKNLLRVSSGDKISYTQGKSFEEFLIEAKVEKSRYQDTISTGTTHLELTKGINATILSPTPNLLKQLHDKWPELSRELEEDLAEEKISAANDAIRTLTLQQLAATPFLPNGTVEADIFNSSSIAFILETLDCRILLLGDARPEVILQSLRNMDYNDSTNKLRVDYVKIAHHGSKNNTSNELLDMIDCNRFIISTNGGTSRHKHPDRETVARILYHPARDWEQKVHIYLNYHHDEIKARKGSFLHPHDIINGNWELHTDTQNLPL